MSEASTTEESTTSDLTPEPTVAEQAEQNEASKSAKTTDANDTSETSTTKPIDANETSNSSTNQTDNHAPSEPSNSEPVNSDDWAAAMAEQAPTVNGVAKSDDLSKEETTPVFEQFSKDGELASAKNDIDMILDIPVQLTVELGRTKIAIKNLMQLAQGSVVELDGMAGEPMDVLVNGCLIAQGEVVVVNDKFGIRLTDIITPSERIRKLNR